ncbi:hypothetical protein BFQ13_11630 [Escherichia coli]|nr:hypothetical protein BFQ13_11630 [Escherichia coli]
MLRECDYSQALLEQVNQAISDKTPLVIQGSNSKAFLGRPVTGQTLDVRCHRGIVNYDPTELVITARAGTPLVAIEAALESVHRRWRILFLLFIFIFFQFALRFS